MKELRKFLIDNGMLEDYCKIIMDESCVYGGEFVDAENTLRNSLTSLYNWTLVSEHYDINENTLSNLHDNWYRLAKATLNHHDIKISGTLEGRMALVKQLKHRPKHELIGFIKRLQ